MKPVCNSWRSVSQRPRTGSAGQLLVAICLNVALFASANAVEVESVSGPVKVLVTLSPDAPLIGDTLTLHIKVSAEPDVEVLMPDFGDALDQFSIVDFAPRQSIDAEGNSQSIQTYRLDPPSSGKQVIPPILIEYVDRRDGQKAAPDGLDAYEILTERIPFEVGSVLPEGDENELRPPLGELQPLESDRGSGTLWLVITAFALTLLAPLLWITLSNARRRQKRRSAYDVAKTRMERLLRQPRSSSEELEEFYVGLSLLVRQYIEDRFEMRAPELTSEEFLSSIGESPDFSPEHRRLLGEFLRQADLVKFARKEPTGDETDAAIEKANRFLDETREETESIGSPRSADVPSQPRSESRGD